MRFLRLQYQLFRIRRRNAIQVYPIEPEFPDTLDILRFTCSLTPLSFVSKSVISIFIDQNKSLPFEQPYPISTFTSPGIEQLL